MATIFNAGLGVLQWLATPIIAIAGIWIALQQQRLADIKLRNDVFDRRYKIFEATQELIAYGIFGGQPNHNVIRAFERDTAVAPFFFDDKIVSYLVELRLSIEKLDRLFFKLGEDGAISAELAKQQGDDVRKRLRRESEGLVARFRPSMGLRPSSRWW